MSNQIIINQDQAKEQFEMVFIEDAEAYIFASDIMYWLNEKNIDADEVKIYGTYSQKMHIDADDIIEMACEELYEDAYQSIGEKEKKELQELLDKWVEKHGKPATTYYPDYKYRIIVEDCECL